MIMEKCTGFLTEAKRITKSNYARTIAQPKPDVIDRPSDKWFMGQRSRFTFSQLCVNSFLFISFCSLEIKDADS